MTATNMCSNFGSKWSSPPLIACLMLWCTIHTYSTNTIVDYPCRSSTDIFFPKFLFLVGLPVYYLSKEFKACLESFGS